VRAHLLRPEERLLAYPWSSFGYYLAAPEHRPEWMRVDRLLGEHGLPQDTALARQEFERRMEARRLQMGTSKSASARLHTAMKGPGLDDAAQGRLGLRERTRHAMG
jgi:hypothetical protein